MFEEKGEPKRIEPRSFCLYQPSALPLGHTGSQRPRRYGCAFYGSCLIIIPCLGRRSFPLPFPRLGEVLRTRTVPRVPFAVDNAALSSEVPFLKSGAGQMMFSHALPCCPQLCCIGCLPSASSFTSPINACRCM